MKSNLLTILLFFTLVGCTTHKNLKTNIPKDYTAITIDTLFTDQISIRALLIDNKRIWYAADKARYGYFDLNSHLRNQFILSTSDNQLDYRSIAQNDEYIFILSAGSPALLYRINKSSGHEELVYKDSDPDIFFDSMAFYDNDNGIAVGDPKNGKFVILQTKNGGKTWRENLPENCPNALSGEGAFAASNTSLVITNKYIWITSGGARANVYKTNKKAQKWESFSTPITQNTAMNGIFSAAFYNDKVGFIVGGDYGNQSQNFNNKAVTKNGGKTWDLVSPNQAFGYTSCVQYVPNSNGHKLVTVGPSGVYYSSNGGMTWQQFSDFANFHTIRFINDKTAIAAGKNILAVISLH